MVTLLNLELTEFSEKLDNALQATGDMYLARIYAAALELFRVHVVGTAVDRKLAIIRDTYTALHDESSSAGGASGNPRGGANRVGNRASVRASVTWMSRQPTSEWDPTGALHETT
ncbi:MAG TPA: hypothetical protein VMH85_04145 [Terriglobales bacterium]|nr:hypothetical protein [Terriglobales bacterium]